MSELTSHLPHSPGVYLMRDLRGEVIYIGKALDLAKRVGNYFQTGRPVDLKTRTLVPLIRKIDYIACASERDALLLERKLIRRDKPFFNSMWKDDKSYPFVKLTMNEDFPRLLWTRKKVRDGALYFGPYPKVSMVRSLLRYLWTRRLFPLRPCRYDFSEANPLEPRKISGCLYYHTRACPAPCAGPARGRVSKGDYRRIARRAAYFFEGQFGRLRREFASEMGRASKVLDYEHAAQLRDNLRALEHMSERVLLSEIREEDLGRRLAGTRGVTALQEALGLARPPVHIEAFDISHLQGRHTVGSMVCFVDGVPHKDHYRRFKIRTVAGIDDFRSMREVVARRYGALKEDGQPLPDLVLIDGGKGQLGMAVQALEEVGVQIPLASLAKREEEVFVPGREEPLGLAQDSPALLLLEHLRDEAHRFGVTYNRLLRTKGLFPGGTP